MKNQPSELAIPVLLQGTAVEPTGMARAVLKELEAHLACLLETGEGGSVDLRRLPLGPADRDWLQRRLGEGEVRIEFEAEGRSHITETGLAGVWWVRHYDGTEALVAELIEVAWVPQILPAHPDDVRAALERLQRRRD